MNGNVGHAPVSWTIMPFQIALRRFSLSCCCGVHGPLRVLLNSPHAAILVRGRFVCALQQPDSITDRRWVSLSRLQYPRISGSFGRHTPSCGMLYEVSILCFFTLPVP